MTTSKKPATKESSAGKAAAAKVVAKKGSTASGGTGASATGLIRAWEGDVNALIAKESTEVVSLGIPFSVFLGECVDCARFIREFWEPLDGERPGLVCAAKPGDGDASFNLQTADIILRLHSEVLTAQTQYLLSAKAKKSAAGLLERAAKLLDDMSAALEWYFDDGVEDDKDAQLGAVRAAHDLSSGAMDVVAAALESYAGLAEKHIDAIDGTLGFERAFVDEARKVSRQLFEMNSALESNPESEAALKRRNKLVAALRSRVLRTRKVAQLVFRAQPEIARLVTSAYQRRARTALRRSAAGGAPKVT
ncbi:MAG: hypothetical protein Q8Q09_16510 [Deltaproteobacteria bacterium]|nr:hypothetical protein [Deltaproteobacteria bacterium]